MHIMSRVVTSLHILLCNHQPIFANGLKVVPLLSPLRLRTRRGYSVTAIISNRRIVSKPPAIPSRHVISSAVKMTRGDNSNDDTNDDAHDSNDGEWTTFDPKTCQGVYGLGISAVAPRPVAVITSRSKNGTLNCAPFSYTGLLSHDPPLVCHGICLSREGKKDTLVNIEETKQWVYNVLSDTWVKEANACSEEVTSDMNELDIAGLDTLPCDKVNVPRVKRALVAMECEFESKKEIINDDGMHTTTVVFGRIVKYHIHSSVLGGTEERPVVDLEKIRLCGRVGGTTYWPAGEGKTLSMERP